MTYGQAMVKYLHGILYLETGRTATTVIVFHKKDDGNLDYDSHGDAEK